MARAPMEFSDRSERFSKLEAANPANYPVAASHFILLLHGLIKEQRNSPNSGTSSPHSTEIEKCIGKAHERLLHDCRDEEGYVDDEALLQTLVSLYEELIVQLSEQEVAGSLNEPEMLVDDMKELIMLFAGKYGVRAELYAYLSEIQEASEFPAMSGTGQPDEEAPPSAFETKFEAREHFLREFRAIFWQDYRVPLTEEDAETFHTTALEYVRRALRTMESNPAIYQGFMAHYNGISEEDMVNQLAETALHSLRDEALTELPVILQVRIEKWKRKEGGAVDLHGLDNEILAADENELRDFINIIAVQLESAFFEELQKAELSPEMRPLLYFYTHGRGESMDHASGSDVDKSQLFGRFNLYMEYIRGAVSDYCDSLRRPEADQDEFDSEIDAALQSLDNSAPPEEKPIQVFIPSFAHFNTEPPGKQPSTAPEEEETTDFHPIKLPTPKPPPRRRQLITLPLDEAEPAVPEPELKLPPVPVPPAPKPPQKQVAPAPAPAPGPAPAPAPEVARHYEKAPRIEERVISPEPKQLRPLIHPIAQETQRHNKVQKTRRWVGMAIAGLLATAAAVVGGKKFFADDRPDDRMAQVTTNTAPSEQKASSPVQKATPSKAATETPASETPATAMVTEPTQAGTSSGITSQPQSPAPKVQKSSDSPEVAAADIPEKIRNFKSTGKGIGGQLLAHSMEGASPMSRAAMQEAAKSLNKGSYADMVATYGSMTDAEMNSILHDPSHPQNSELRYLRKNFGHPKTWVKTFNEKPVEVVYEKEMKEYREFKEDMKSLGKDNPHITWEGEKLDLSGVRWAKKLVSLKENSVSGKSGSLDIQKQPKESKHGSIISPSQESRYASVHIVKPGSSENVDMSFIRSKLRETEEKKIGRTEVRPGSSKRVDISWMKEKMAATNRAKSIETDRRAALLERGEVLVPEVKEGMAGSALLAVKNGFLKECYAVQSQDDVEKVVNNLRITDFEEYELIEKDGKGYTLARLSGATLAKLRQAIKPKQEAKKPSWGISDDEMAEIDRGWELA